MKNLILVLFSCLFMAQSCSTTTIGQDVISIQDSKVSNNGELYVKSWVYSDRMWGDIKKEGLKNALDKVLFYGIPGSKVKRPLITNTVIRDNYSDYFDAFFEDDGPYLNFGQVLSVDPKDRIEKGKGYRAGVQCKIYYKRLKKELVDRGIIQKFGI